MDMHYKAVILAFCIIIIILSARLYYYRKQISHMIKQLDFLENPESNFCLTSANRVGRTAELVSRINQAAEKFRAQMRRLQKTNKSYRESITSISHDIRTPLTSVKGYVQMLQNPSVSEDKKRVYQGIIEQRLEDLSQMLDQLFEYARLEAGEMELHPERINAGNLFAATISMFYEEFVKNSCEPKVEISEKPCFIWADRHAFVRIVENLMKNALVHGTGSYCFSLSSVEKQVSICISNETDSIEEKEIGRIFERFYTTDQSRSRRSTGLGLAIAQGFAQQMGGEIEAHLEGGRFSVTVYFSQIFNTF